jgi:hypothetical protein
VENVDLVKSVYSMMIMVQIIPFLYERETGKNGVGREQERGRKRESKIQIDCRI